MPCSRCFKNNLPCRIEKNKSDRCAECTRLGRVCDGSSVASALTRLLADQERLELEEEKAEKELFVLQTKLQTMMNRLVRLRRQKRILKDRGAEMFRRGMVGLEEVEAEERRVAAEADFVAQDVSSLGVTGPDLGSFGLDLPIDPSFDWEALFQSPVVGTPPTASGTPPGAP